MSRNIVLFFNSDGDEQTAAVVLNRENAVKLAIRLAMAYPHRGVQAAGWDDDEEDYTIELYTSYPTTTKEES